MVTQGFGDMASKALTDIAIRNLKPTAQRREIADTVPLLYLIVQPSGRRRFCLRYRVHGRSRKMTLAAGLTLAAARKIAGDAALAIELGNDPADARRAAREKAAEAQANTLANVCAEYLRREGPKLRTADQRARLLKQHVYGPLGHRPIGSIRRGEIVRLLDKVEDNSGTRSADMVLAVLRKVMRWHAVRDENYVPAIVPGMRRQKPKEHERSRVLSDDELRKVWHAADPATPYGALIRTLLLTGARRGEAAAMRWGELLWHKAADFTGDVWELPAGRNKAKEDLVRPLSRAALALLGARPRIQGSDFVFSVDGRYPLSGLAMFKKRFDVACGVGGWTHHDLRRTARTLLSRAGINKDHGERMLGHVIGGVRGTYDKYEYPGRKSTQPKRWRR